MERKSAIKEIAESKKKKPLPQQSTLNSEDLFEVQMAGMYRSTEGKVLNPFPFQGCSNTSVPCSILSKVLKL